MSKSAVQQSVSTAAEVNSKLHFSVTNNIDPRFPDTFLARITDPEYAGELSFRLPLNDVPTEEISKISKFATFVAEISGIQMGTRYNAAASLKLCSPVASSDRMEDGSLDELRMRAAARRAILSAEAVENVPF